MYIHLKSCRTYSCFLFYITLCKPWFSPFLDTSINKNIKELRPEPLFVNLLRIPGIDSQPGGPLRQPYLSYRAARLYTTVYRLYSGIVSSESIPGLLKRLQIQALVLYRKYLHKQIRNPVFNVCKKIKIINFQPLQTPIIIYASILFWHISQTYSYLYCTSSEFCFHDNDFHFE